MHASGGHSSDAPLMPRSDRCQRPWRIVAADAGDPHRPALAANVALMPVTTSVSTGHARDPPGGRASGYRSGTVSDAA